MNHPVGCFTTLPYDLVKMLYCIIMLSALPLNYTTSETIIHITNWHHLLCNLTYWHKYLDVLRASVSMAPVSAALSTPPNNWLKKYGCPKTSTSIMPLSIALDLYPIINSPATLLIDHVISVKPVYLGNPSTCI